MINKTEALRLFSTHLEAIVNSKQGQNLLQELKIADTLGHTYVDAYGYDAIDKDGKLVEYKSCDSRTNGRAQWTSCGTNKRDADYFILWDVITNLAAKVPNEKVQQYQQGGQIKAYLSDSSSTGRSDTILETSSWFKCSLEELVK